MSSDPSQSVPPPHPSFSEALRFWVKLGFISFGGPTGQIAIMHQELVERRRWIGEARFLHALNYCMLLPGPEATQLATYIGWLLHGALGGVAAGALFVLPSIVILWALSFVYVTFGNVPAVAAVFYGLKPAVVAIVAAAVIRIGRKALKNGTMWSIAAVAFAAIHFFHAPFPLIVLGAAAAGWVGGKLLPGQFAGAAAHAPSGKAGDAVLDDYAETARHVRPGLARGLRVIAVCTALWWLPVLAAGWSLGWNHTLFREGVFFSKAAMVTFGGAYAVLPYVAQQAVETHGWLSHSQMLDGLGLAETTPGPLIMVLQFVGFLGGWHHPGGLPPLIAATLGALITTWTTFVPCFLWIFLGAPHIEQMRGNQRLGSALSAVTAAVVGVVLNLAVWFAAAALFPSTLDGGRRVDGFAVAAALTAFIGLVRWKWDVIPVVAAAGAAGLLYKLLVV